MHGEKEKHGKYQYELQDIQLWWLAAEWDYCKHQHKVQNKMLSERHFFRMWWHDLIFYDGYNF
jgi:hypothetical protein